MIHTHTDVGVIKHSEAVMAGRQAALILRVLFLSLCDDDSLVGCRRHVLYAELIENLLTVRACVSI